MQIVQQELNLIPTLSVAENLLLGRYPQLWGVINRRRLHEQARAALDRFGLQEIDTDQSAGSLGVGQQQMLEIAAALDRKCKLLILDEPTAALSAGPVKRRRCNMRCRNIRIIPLKKRCYEWKVWQAGLFGMSVFPFRPASVMESQVWWERDGPNYCG